MAVNVANLGRKPYRSLSADVVRILDDDLGMLLRGEIIWKKADGASGSCAWGSLPVADQPRPARRQRAGDRRLQGPFRPGRRHRRAPGPGPPVPAVDLDRRVPRRHPGRVGHPRRSRPAGSGTRHRSPWSCRNGSSSCTRSGTTWSSTRSWARGRRPWPRYGRAGATSATTPTPPTSRSPRSGLPRRTVPSSARSSFRDPEHRGLSSLDRGGQGGPGAGHRHPYGRRVRDPRAGPRVPGVGILVDVVARDAGGAKWYFDVTGAFTSTRGGLLRTDTLWKCLGRASVLRARGIKPVVLLSSHLPPRRSTGDQALRTVGPSGVHDVVGMLDGADRRRLVEYAAGGHQAGPFRGSGPPPTSGPRPERGCRRLLKMHCAAFVVRLGRRRRTSTPGLDLAPGSPGDPYNPGSDALACSSVHG